MRFIPSVYETADSGRPKKVVFGIPIPKGQPPHPKTVDSLRASIPLIKEAGWLEGYTQTTGNPYISGARAEITRRALDAGADVIIYIDYDVSWRPEDMMTLLTTQGDVVAGTYRVKTDDPSQVLYMGAIFSGDDGRPLTREDGCISAKVVPAGFLKVTTGAIDTFMRSYPELCYGPQYSLSVDLFNHGAHKGLWWGEDYAFSRNYIDCGGEIWIIPNMNIDHHCFDRVDNGVVIPGTSYKGNFHEYLLSQPGGSKFALVKEENDARQEYATKEN